MILTQEQINEIANQVADDILSKVKQIEDEINNRDLLVGKLIGDGAIPVNGRENFKAPCKGCRIDLSKPFEAGNAMVTTEGAIGTLSQEEVRDWCSELIEETDGRCERARAIKEAAEECKAKYPDNSTEYFACFIPKFKEAASTH